MGLDSLVQRLTVGAAAGLALLAGEVPQPAFAADPESEVKKPEASLYTLLFSRNISERDHAIEGMFNEVYDILHQVYDTRKEPKKPFKLGDREKKALDKARTQVNQKIDALEAVASQRELGIEKAFFEKQREFVRGIDPTQYDWSLPFHPALWKEEFVAAVDNAVCRMLQRTEEKWLEAQGIKTPEGFVLIPAGTFVKGSNRKEAQYFENIVPVPSEWKGNFPNTDQPRTYSPVGYMAEVPRSPTMVRKSFWMAIHEVTNQEYARFLIATNRQNSAGVHWKGGDTLPYTWKDGQTPPVGQENWPFMFADGYAAIKASAFLGARLPTAEEWELAGRGYGGRLWPWGNRLDLSLGAFRETIKERGEYLAKVGSFSSDKSPFGSFDMAGNIGEWTGSIFSAPVTPDWDNVEKTRDRKEYVNLRIIKSGGWPVSSGLSEHRLARTIPLNPIIGDKIGFRCVMDIAPQPQYIQPSHPPK